MEGGGSRIEDRGTSCSFHLSSSILDLHLQSSIFHSQSSILYLLSSILDSSQYSVQFIPRKLYVFDGRANISDRKP